MLGIVLVLAVLGMTCLIQYGLIGRVFVPVIIAGVLSVLAVVLASRVMPRKTDKGRMTWEKIMDRRSTSAGPKSTVSRKMSVRVSFPNPILLTAPNLYLRANPAKLDSRSIWHGLALSR